MAKKRKLQHDASVPPDNSTKRQAMSFFDLPAEMRNAVYELLAATYMGEKVLCWQEGLHIARPKLLQISRQFAGEANGYINDARWRLTPIDLGLPPPLKTAQGNLSEFIRQHETSAASTRLRPLRIALTIPAGAIRLDTLTCLVRTLLHDFLAQKAAPKQPLDQEQDKATGSQPESSGAPRKALSREAFRYTVSKGGDIDFEVLDAQADARYIDLVELALWPSSIDPVLLGPTSQAWGLSASWNSVREDIFFAVMGWRKDDGLWRRTWNAWHRKVRRKHWGLKDVVKHERKK